MDPPIVEQLRRQSLWLKDSWLWLLREKVLTGETKTALEVGCGAGHVMEILSQHLDVRGIDNDPDMVALCQQKGLAVSLADAGELPFPDGSFDIVYCSYLMLWLPKPINVVREMARVSKKWVICLAEPDYGARIDYPPELGVLGLALVTDLKSKGADPFIGRKLRSIFASAGLNAEIGIHQGVWPIERTGTEIIRELDITGRNPELRNVVKRASDNGSLMQYNPVFYAIAQI